MANVTLRNTTKEKITIRSADQDSVAFGPGLTAEVDDKFMWNLPRGIRVIQANAVIVAESPSTEL